MQPSCRRKSARPSVIALSAYPKNPSKTGSKNHCKTKPCQSIAGRGPDAGRGIIKVAREVGVGKGTVQRIKAEMTGPFADAAA